MSRELGGDSGGGGRNGDSGESRSSVESEYFTGSGESPPEDGDVSGVDVLPLPRRTYHQGCHLDTLTLPRVHLDENNNNETPMGGEAPNYEMLRVTSREQHKYRHQRQEDPRTPTPSRNRRGRWNRFMRMLKRNAWLCQATVLLFLSTVSVATLLCINYLLKGEEEEGKGVAESSVNFYDYCDRQEKYFKQLVSLGENILSAKKHKD